MAIKARNVGHTFPHVLKRDVRPEGQEGEDWKPTTFMLKVLDSRVLGILKDKSTKITVDPSRPDDMVGTEVGQNEYYQNVCQFGIAGVDNYDAKYGTIKRNIGGRSYEVATPEFVGTIDEDDVAELAETILKGNSLTPAEGNV